MPFTKPYREKFEKGDLVYGMREPRTTWLMKHGAVQGMNWIDKFKIDEDQVTDAVNMEFIVKTLDHPKYHTVMETADHERTTKGKQHIWRTKSKAGLNWAVTAGKHVHFILDWLDMEAVATKTNTKGSPDFPKGKAPIGTTQIDKVRTITNAELRWIYRHKDNPEVQKYIQFWLDNKTSCPPWSPEFTVGVGKNMKRGDTMWALYTPTHTYSDGADLSRAD
jgi:hypothetical protein